MQNKHTFKTFRREKLTDIMTLITNQLKPARR